jgi:hypothetical protein
MAMNKQLLAQYTWMEQDIISIKGEKKRMSCITCEWDQTANHKRRPWTLAPSLTMTGDAADCAFHRSERCCNKPIDKET